MYAENQYGSCFFARKTTALKTIAIRLRLKAFNIPAQRIALGQCIPFSFAPCKGNITINFIAFYFVYRAFSPLKLMFVLYPRRCHWAGILKAFSLNLTAMVANDYLVRRLSEKPPNAKAAFFAYF